MGCYKEIGICIWCLKKEPEVSFINAPHTISKQLGSTQVGFDICDICNHYFGTKDSNLPYQMGVELAFKEIMNLMRFLLKKSLLKKTNHPARLRSVYFNYYHSKNAIQIKNSFKFKEQFMKYLTRQFKKGMYEIFLQEYHRVTKNGLDSRFDLIRNFVRYDYGDLPIYFLENNGVYLIPKEIDNISLTFSESNLSNINIYGFYVLFIYGNIFYLEVTPMAQYTRDVFLKKQSDEIIGTGTVYASLKTLNIITDLDFTLRNLYG